MPSRGAPSGRSRMGGMESVVAFLSPEPALMVLVVVLVLFGGKKIPELMRGVGQGIGELKRGVDDVKGSMPSLKD